MRLLLLLLVFGLTSQLWSQVTHLSLHYHATRPDLLPTSDSALSHFKNMHQSGDYTIQIIEINAFTEVGTGSATVQLAEQRISDLLQFLGDDEVISTNAYGHKHQAVAFPVTSWERIDMYYYIEERTSVTENISPTSELIATRPDTASKPSTSDSMSLFPAFTTQKLQIHVNFYGSSVRMKPGSEEELERLKTILCTDTTLRAEIRGHVCCGNKRFLSRKRAREVFRYLVSAGISKERLNFRGFGNTDPLIYPERGPGDRAMNRRVEVVFDRPVSIPDPNWGQTARREVVERTSPDQCDNARF